MAILIEDRPHGIRILTINRPNTRNALDLQTYRELAEGIDTADADPTVRVTVLTGGSGVFTSGNDLSDFRDHPDTSGALQLLHALIGAEKPVVAAVEGYAIGIGTTMLLHCDFAYAGTSTVFALPFVKLGLSPEGGSTLLLPEVAGPKHAAAMLMLGDRFDAQRAMSSGVITEIVEDSAALGRAAETAEALTRLPTESLRITKQLLRRNRSEVARVVDEEAELFAQRCKSDDARAAFDSFSGTTTR